jgi:hypothetical protein
MGNLTSCRFHSCMLKSGCNVCKYRRDDPKIQQLVQGSFQWDWVHAHSARAHAATCAAAVTNRPVARSFKAADGHGAAAAQAGAGKTGTSLENFKLSKFKRVAARTNTFRQPPMQRAVQA